VGYDLKFRGSNTLVDLIRQWGGSSTTKGSARSTDMFRSHTAMRLEPH